MAQSKEILELPNTVSGRALADLVGLTDRQLRNLATEGIIPRPERGKYDLRAAVLAILDRARNSAASAADAERIAFMKAKREALEMDTAEKRRELIPIEEHNLVMTTVFGSLKSEFLGLPARTTRDMAVRVELDREIAAALNRAAAKLSSLADDWRAGRAIEIGGTEDES